MKFVDLSKRSVLSNDIRNHPYSIILSMDDQNRMSKNITDKPIWSISYFNDYYEMINIFGEPKMHSIEKRTTWWGRNRKPRWLFKRNATKKTFHLYFETKQDATLFRMRFIGC